MTDESKKTDFEKLTSVLSEIGADGWKGVDMIHQLVDKATGKMESKSQGKAVMLQGRLVLVFDPEGKYRNVTVAQKPGATKIPEPSKN